MKDYWVWSGSLRGAEVRASSPEEAVIRAVQQNIPCLLREVIRVSEKPTGAHLSDTYFEAPYHETFPELFTGDLDVSVARIQST